MAVGLEYVEALQFGNTPSPELTAKFEAMDGAVLGLLRALLGLDRVEWAASAAAPMPEDVARFFAGLGMRIYDVYGMRSEEHTSELQSLMRISYAVFCLKKKKKIQLTNGE